MTQEETSPKNARIPEGQAIDLIYSNSSWFYKKLIIGAILAFIVALSFNFPVRRNIKKLIVNQLRANRACPISYQSLDVELFLPKIIFDSPVIPGKCFKNPRTQVEFDSMIAKITMPSFWPLGIKSRIEAKSGESVFNIYPRLAIGGNAIQVEDTVISGEFISNLTQGININGSFNVQGHFELEGGKVDTGSLKIDSSNAALPSQTINNFTIPGLNIGKIELAGNMIKNTFHLKAFRIGREGSPIRGEFKGKIKFSQGNIALSTMDLQGKINFAEDFLNQIPFIRLLLNGKKQSQGFYYLNLSGTFSRPTPQFIDPQ